MNSEAHIYAEVYKAVYAANMGQFERQRQREAEQAAQQAVWTFKDTQPKTHQGYAAEDTSWFRQRDDRQGEI